MAPRDGRPTACLRAGAVLLLLAGPLLLGCLSDPSSQLTARRGDLASLELVVADDGTVVLPAGHGNASVAELCGQPLADLGSTGCPAARADYVLLDDRPAHLPPEFANATALPSALVDGLSGLGEGEHRTLADVQVWGPHRDSLVREHGRTDRIPRIVEDPTAYGRTWNGTRLDNGSFEIEPDQRGATVEVPNWCNQRFCLFTSQLVNWTKTNLVVEHEASVGQTMHVRSLDTFLSVVEADPDSFVVDGNDPRAGEDFDVYAKVQDLRGPPQGERRAPSFNLTRVDGGRVALADLLGKPVVIEFFATWCPSCRENADHLASVQERFGDRVNIVSIDVDPWESSKAIRSFIDEHNVTWPVAVDEKGEVSQDYSVGTLSTEVVVDPQGVIRHVETGVVDHDRIVDLLEALLEQAGDGDAR